ncbi:hypothetical protein C8R45DRAFT_920514 [Mycena sanguinolenta]|nr:hypothetical protein C8R45DRAFT_920514 [Mycena sanguinolenta]
MIIDGITGLLLLFFALSKLQNIHARWSFSVLSWAKQGLSCFRELTNPRRPMREEGVSMLKPKRGKPTSSITDSAQPLSGALIVGIGIDGLAGAIALRRSGHNVQVFEASRTKTAGKCPTHPQAVWILSGQPESVDSDGTVVFDAKNGSGITRPWQFARPTTECTFRIELFKLVSLNMSECALSPKRSPRRAQASALGGGEGRSISVASLSPAIRK